MIKKLMLLILITVFALTACDSDSPEEIELLSFNADEFPRLDGSTATIPLSEAAAAVLMGIDRSEASDFINFSGTDRSFMNLLEDRADLLIVYTPSEATRRDTRIGNLNKQPIGSDALVFIVNAANPVENLTIEQIRAIYSGEITNWNELGGHDAPIIPFQRNTTAGSHALMESLVMYDTDFIIPPLNQVIGGMGAMMTAVAEFDSGEHAIGYHVFFYVAEMMQNPNIRMLSVNGVSPSQETISSREYSLTNHFYAVIRPDEAEDSPARRMQLWLQSPEGQALIYMEGYAPLNTPR